jgi:hypothetical protein
MKGWVMPELQSALNQVNEFLLFRPLRRLSAIALLGAVACQANIGDPNQTVGAGTSGTSDSPSGGGPQGGNSTSGSAGKTNAGGNSATTAGTGSGNAPSGSGGSTSTSGSTGNPIDTTPPPVGGELSTCTTPGPRLIRRLTSVQFRNTLVDVFQDPNVPTTDIFSDPFTMRFHVDADVPVVRDLDAGLIMDYAETVADWAVKNNKLGRFVTCTTLTDQNCRKQFIQNLGLQLEREPIPDARLSKYDALNANVKTFQEFETDVVTAMIESPYFVYRRELGVSDSGSYKLSPYEVASELSYFLIQSAPDATLLDAAKNGRLTSPMDIDTQAARLLATPAGEATLAAFVDGWLEIDGLRTKTKDQSVFMLTDALRDAMIKETERTFLDAFRSDSDVGKLLSTKQTFLNKPLADFYQMSGSSSATEFTKVDLSSSTRAAGVLGQAAFLAQHAQPENSSPVQRGRAIRERFLCQPIPEVPKNLNTTLAPPGTFSTNRERFEQHSKDQVCTGCHKNFDPVGFAFENFDTVGRYRSQEVDKQGVTHPIDATGTLSGMPEGDVPLSGAASLIEYLSKSDQVRACVVRYWSYYVHGRDNWPEKKCNDDSVRRESATKGNSLKSVLMGMGILHAPTFVRRVKEQQ